MNEVIKIQIAKLMIREINMESVRYGKLNDLINAKETCDLLECSPSTLYRMRRDDYFSYAKIEGRKNVMLKRKEVEEYISKFKKLKS